ncbi:carboxypeptidase-like regulatory domain-containing protein [Calycomorphotria hydatis]|nr:carboxypeptidase-like regulatory domain-containing protein [Calycomorphotria hydatis]
MRYLLSLTFCLFMIGCGYKVEGPDIAPVRGMVTLDGKPLANASVEFQPINVAMSENGLGGSGANGFTDEAGQFTMYVGSRAGAQAGTYRVLISKSNSATDTDPAPPQILPPKYNSQSQMEVTIPERGNTELNFELESN